MKTFLATLTLLAFVLSGCARKPAADPGPAVKPRPIGAAFEGRPWITHLEIVDLDEDGLPDVLASDAKQNAVQWLRQHPRGVFEEQTLADKIAAPAHVATADMDGDGDTDVLVASMGVILPSNEKIGRVIVLENTGDGFAQRVLLEDTARVTDVQAGDLDNDGDMDLVVGQFGYHDGEIRWMENQGDWQFESHNLLRLSGTIHTPIADMDGDGDLDITAIVSQEWEELYVFENNGSGAFTKRLVYAVGNPDYGSSGISLADLDQDGDPDILYTNGDAFDYAPPGPRPWHGVQWLENKGELSFTFHRIAAYKGAYNARAIDMDGDDDLDIAVVSLFNDWRSRDAASLRWFQNDGQQTFTSHALAHRPTHLLALDAGDLDGDGRPDLVTGAMHAHPPYEHISRILLWKNTTRE